MQGTNPTQPIIAAAPHNDNKDMHEKSTYDVKVFEIMLNTAIGSEDTTDHNADSAFDQINFSP